ncbi:aldo/keto reductase [Glycomyces harbinensis]|uniref:D-threo-aldose 1-dehydrogenase n=1 Tax=Glycomyces harbinensis TaxID=58114 RepID=A0A1G6UQ12_9ACTN|nr:aldo/keto reductase [Glycomyces harbinensis]SDD43373.1 D-threo-aldose 1-dehydrogenase [Glycomyces harbinensis]
MQRNTLGKTGIEVSPLCIGTSPLANMGSLYGYEVTDARAVATIRSVFDSGINFLDTSNGYGEDGIAERRVGMAIRENGGLPDDFILQTKVDPDPETRDYSGARVRASVEESLDRLGIEHLPILALHDPEFMEQDGFAPGGALEALVAIRDAGIADHLAVASGSVEVSQRYLDTGEFDVVLNHNRFTLLNREAQGLFERARAAGLGVLNAAPYGGGMLAKGPEQQPKYCYDERDDAFADAAFAMAEACKRAGVPLIAAALQFSVRSPLVDSTVVGVSRPERVGQTLDLLEVQIPESLWEELETLVPDARI